MLTDWTWKIVGSYDQQVCEAASNWNHGVNLLSESPSQVSCYSPIRDADGRGVLGISACASLHGGVSRFSNVQVHARKRPEYLWHDSHTKEVGEPDPKSSKVADIGAPPSDNTVLSVSCGRMKPCYPINNAFRVNNGVSKLAKYEKIGARFRIEHHSQGRYYNLYDTPPVTDTVLYGPLSPQICFNISNFCLWYKAILILSLVIYFTV